MHRERHAVLERIAEHRGVFPLVGNCVAAFGEVVLAHRLQKFGVGGVGLVFQFGHRGERHAILGDHAANALAEAFVFERAREDGKVDATAGFFPRAEGAGGDVGAHALGGLAVVRPFPIVNYARAVGGEMGDPAASH